MRGFLGCVVVLLLLVLFSACESSGGIASGVDETCRAGVRQGGCVGTYKEISGRYLKEIDLGKPVQSIQVDIALEVEEGTLNVSVKDELGKETTAQAVPGSPVKLSSQVLVDDQCFMVEFESQGQRVKGVSYRIEYSYAPLGE
ncbi:MAG: hypothetical protein GYA17_03045 [Chloroflexi bacterium]|jgi:hypothetical protein|nr:hypothetical protein [Anaerolineaceae bacterium]NMB87308.1 hypothetical protein [Chloroflexota bacterium]